MPGKKKLSFAQINVKIRKNLENHWKESLREEASSPSLQVFSLWEDIF